MRFVKRFLEVLLHFFCPVTCRVCGKPGVNICDDCKKRELERRDDARDIQKNESLEDYIYSEVNKAIEKVLSDKIEQAVTKALEKSGNKIISEQPVPEEDEYIKYLFESKPVSKRINRLVIHSAALYYSNVKEIIFDFKYNGNKSLCIPLGRAMAKFFSHSNATLPDADYIVPVPLHIDSTRGYNQAYEIAKGMSEIWNISAIEAAQWTKIVPDRIGLTAKERKMLSVNDFRVIQDLRNMKVVIVDDVCTTGTTLLRLSQCLENSGAIVVCAYALAFTSD